MAGRGKGQAGKVFRTEAMLFVLMGLACCVRNASVAFRELEGFVKHFILYSHLLELAFEFASLNVSQITGP